jgi:predicted transcriptional regulator
VNNKNISAQFIFELRNAAKDKNIILEVDAINRAVQKFQLTCIKYGVPNNATISETAKRYIEFLLEAKDEQL